MSASTSSALGFESFRGPAGHGVEAASLSLCVRKRWGVLATEEVSEGFFVLEDSGALGVQISRSICVLLTRKAAHSSVMGWGLGVAFRGGFEGRWKDGLGGGLLGGLRGGLAIGRGGGGIVPGLGGLVEDFGVGLEEHRSREVLMRCLSGGLAVGLVDFFAQSFVRGEL